VGRDGGEEEGVWVWGLGLGVEFYPHTHRQTRAQNYYPKKVNP